MTDHNEPTAWEDINPPMVSARRHVQQSPCSGYLNPATSDQFRNELTACLALTAPVGMTEEGRREWLMVAWETLKHLPPDLLSFGCEKARQTCDHPSKIVPAIVAATEQSMKWRREPSHHEDVPRLTGPGPDYCSAEEAAKILQEYGLKR